MKAAMIAEKMSKIDQMETYMQDMQRQIRRKDEENTVFMNMFSQGMLAADEDGVISIVPNPAD